MLTPIPPLCLKHLGGTLWEEAGTLPAGLPLSPRKSRGNYRVFVCVCLWDLVLAGHT